MLTANHLAGFGAGRPSRTITISADENNVNLRTKFNAAGYGGEGGMDLVVVLAPAIVIGSASTANPAMDTGSFGTGCSLTIVQGSGAYIAGAGGQGGNGGHGSSDPGTAGGAGGDGLKISTSIPVYILNTSAFIQGGGGGGGGGQGNTTGGGGDPKNPDPTNDDDGGGGGGGAGRIAGAPGAFPGGGGSGTLTTGGAGEAASSATAGAAGGNRGVAGSASTCAGGAAGKAINLNGNAAPSFLTGGITNTGIFGAIS
jgi:hypothetical protein